MKLGYVLQFSKILLSLGLIAAGGYSFAATVAVNCPSQSINAAITSYFGGSGRPAVSLEKLTLNVSGTCTENVLIPPFKEVELIGVSNAILRPKVTSQWALYVQGLGMLKNFSVFSSGVVGFPGGLIQVGPQGLLRIEFTTVSSATADVLVQAFLTSEVEIRNSFISGGVDTAVEVSNNSHAFIYADGGGTTVIRSSSTGNAIGCYQSNLRVWPLTTTSSIVVGPSKSGIDAANCTGRIGGNNNAGFLRITGATDAAIGGFSDDSFTVDRTVITGNPGAAVRIRAGTVRINSSAIGNNGSGVHASQEGVIFFDDNYGPNTVYQSVDPYNCYQGGRIYADPGDITGAVSDGCLQIGSGD